MAAPARVSADDLTVSEKILLLSGENLWSTRGVPRLNIAPLTLSDGPHGVRKPIGSSSDGGLYHSSPATCFPPACCTACSWDVDLMQQVGTALSRECLALKVHVLLGPGFNIKRHGGGGRNFEYFSEDPILSARLAQGWIRGMQASGQVGACAKHYAVNNQESFRFVMNAVVDPRTLHEIYLRAFSLVCNSSMADPAAVPWSVMCAYNQVNGVYCSEHPYLNQKLLRETWQYEGVLMTDWGATNDRVAGIKASIDLEMPGSSGAHTPYILEALKDQVLSMQQLNTGVNRMLNLLQKRPPSPVAPSASLLDEHHELAHRVALECVVLLKNEDRTVPLQASTWPR
jgi:beta-glucosidase